jgi:two-component system, NtrC family, sensor kinase
VSETNGRVLVVDDLREMRSLMRAILADAGYDVLEAATGAEGLAQMSRNPDLVMLDVHLPDISGFEVCRRIRSNKNTAEVPVVHVSAMFASPDCQSPRAGANANLPKPFDADELVTLVSRLIREHAAPRRSLTST